MYGQPLANLFVRGREGRYQPVDVVAGLFRNIEKPVIGHQQRGREIVGKLDVATVDTAFRLQGTVARDIVKNVGEFDETQNMCHLEGAVREVECLGELQAAACAS